MHRVWDLSVPIIIDALNSPRTKKAVKLEIAVEMFKKMIPAPTPEEAKQTNYNFTQIFNDLENVRKKQKEAGLDSGTKVRFGANGVANGSG